MNPVGMTPNISIKPWNISLPPNKTQGLVGGPNHCWLHGLPIPTIFGCTRPTHQSSWHAQASIVRYFFENAFLTYLFQPRLLEANKVMARTYLNKKAK